MFVGDRGRLLNPVIPSEVESTARTILLPPAALTPVPCCCWGGWGWLCAVQGAGLSPAPGEPVPGALACLPPLVSAWFSQKHCFQLGSCVCCHFKMCFGMLTSASWNAFLFAPLLRGFINIELHRKQILLLSDCSVVTFLFLKSIMVNFISAQSFVSY